MSPSDVQNLENGGNMVSYGCLRGHFGALGGLFGRSGERFGRVFGLVFVFSVFLFEKCGFVISMALWRGIAAFACPGDQVGARWAQKSLLLLLVLADGWLTGWLAAVAAGWLLLAGWLGGLGIPEFLAIRPIEGKIRNPEVTLTVTFNLMDTRIKLYTGCWIQDAG